MATRHDKEEFATRIVRDAALAHRYSGFLAEYATIEMKYRILRECRRCGLKDVRHGAEVGCEDCVIISVIDV